MKKPDIIFIVLDTQRADRLGTYGHQRAVTPHLDAFAASGVLFEQAISPAQWTIPSHASLFTGLYPTAHQVIQSDKSLGAEMLHVAEVLGAAGYETIGFCNNPLVGIMNNGFKRGFQTFYNYGGAIPSMPQSSSRLPLPLNAGWEMVTQFLRRISYPVQNFFGRSELAFRISLNAVFTPLWSKWANFKGQNERSIRDVVHFLHERETHRPDKPLFLFINLMETHLPFWPPSQFIDQLVPYYRENREARRTMRRWNREAFRWAAPLAEPLAEIEHRVLNDMYDAEVAYQDHYLGGFFNTLAGRKKKDDTLTVIVGDHGDGLGEHGLIGHAFSAYQELVHVPLIMHWPRRLQTGRRLATPVSTRRIFHTLIDAAGYVPEQFSRLDPAEIHRLTFMNTILGRDPEQGIAFSEVYAPINFEKVIEKRWPELLARFRTGSMRRAVVQESLKLIHIDGQADELFHLAHDPQELENVMARRPEDTARLEAILRRITGYVEMQKEKVTAGGTIDLEADEKLLQHLRSLGYIE